MLGLGLVAINMPWKFAGILNIPPFRLPNHGLLPALERARILVGFASSSSSLPRKALHILRIPSSSATARNAGAQHPAPSNCLASLSDLRQSLLR